MCTKVRLALDLTHHWFIAYNVPSIRPIAGLMRKAKREGVE